VGITVGSRGKYRGGKACDKRQKQQAHNNNNNNNNNNTEKSHIGHCTHTSDSTAVKAQNIQHGK